MIMTFIEVFTLGTIAYLVTDCILLKMGLSQYSESEHVVSRTSPVSSKL